MDFTIFCKFEVEETNLNNIEALWFWDGTTNRINDLVLNLLNLQLTH